VDGNIADSTLSSGSYSGAMASVLKKIDLSGRRPWFGKTCPLSPLDSRR
jgi:hypothetical protein